MTITIFLCIIVFLIGLYFYAKNADPKYFEQFTGSTSSGGYKCPNLLIQKGSQIYLYNTSVAEVPGVNPIVFDNLEDYTEFLEWQRSKNIRCPVLYLQQSYDAQGNRVYKPRPNINDPQGGLPPATTQSTSGSLILSPPTNNHNSSANTTEAPYSVTDNGINYTMTGSSSSSKKSNKSRKLSPNPMDPNWGGEAYTQELVDKGYYKGNEVKLTRSGIS